MTDLKPKMGDTRNCDTCGEELQFLPLGGMDRWLETVTSQPHACPGPKMPIASRHYSAWLDQITPTLVALGWTRPAQPAELTEARCPSCDHLTVGHTEDGCWYRFELSPGVDHDPMCPCTLPHGKPAATPKES